MGRPIYKKNSYIITQEGNKKDCYYTIIDISNKPHRHTHVKNFKTAKLILHWANKGRIPNRYPEFMKISISRIIKK